MRGIDGYYDIVWSDVNIEKINQELVEFQNKCRKLPKGMKDWQVSEWFICTPYHRLANLVYRQN